MLAIAPLAPLASLGGFFAGAEAALPLIHPAMMLLAMVLPLSVAFALAFSGKLAEGWVKFFGGLGFVGSALACVWVFLAYRTRHAGGAYAFELFVPTGLDRIGSHLHLGINGIAAPFLLMAGVVGLAAGLYAIISVTERLRLMLVLLLTMQAGLVGVFTSVDVLFFYFFHEFALIPTFILIAMWGRTGRKAVAIEMAVYLTAGAMLTLAGLILLKVQSGAASFSFPVLREAVLAAELQNTVYGFLLLGFGILVSLFPFHSWAPKTYATAPAPAAMLHAGVLKKFGLYGLIQFAYPLLPAGAAHWNPLLVWLAVGNVVVIGLVTLTQRDLKYMLGNASVMHMGYAFLGLFAASTVGLGGAVLMLFAHGLSVALLLLLADCIERRADTVELNQLGGLAQSAPVLMSFFVAGTMASIGLPGFANFWGELAIFLSLWESAAPWAAVAALSGIVISAIYGLRAVAAIFFGEAKLSYKGGDLTLGERIPALALLALLFLVGFWPKTISAPVQDVLQPLSAPAVQAPVAVLK